MRTTRPCLRALLPCLLLAFFALSCEKKDKPQPEPTPSIPMISVSPNGTVSVPAAGGTVKFVVSTNIAYYGYTYPNRDWLGISNNHDDGKNNVLLTLAANDSGEPRKFEVTFFCNKEKGGEHLAETKVTVSQPSMEGGVVVSSSGGTVTSGDMSLFFPEGAYAKSSNVLITPAEKGSVLGEEEVSTFYQVSLRPDVGQPLTVSIPCTVTGDDVNVVARIPALQVSEGESTFCDLILESTYADGVYTAILPASGNRNLSDDDRLTISLGVARKGYLSGNNAVKSIFDEKFTEGNVSWHFIWGYFDKITYETELATHWDDINATIRESLRTLQDMGFSVTKRDIGIQFKDLVIKKKSGTEPLDGAFTQSSWSNESSTVEYNYYFVRDYNKYKNKFRTTCIHELMHDFQADYDPRWAYTKAKSASLDQQLLYESGAVWAEQFMGGAFSTTFTNTYLNDFVMGFEDVETIHGLYDNAAANRYQQYSNQGYGMSVLMQYLSYGMKDYGLDKNAILTLYRDYWNAQNLGTKANIRALTRDKGHDLFASHNYDDFLISLAKGELIPDINARNMMFPLDNSISINQHNPVSEKTGDCYRYGALVQVYLVNITDLSAIKGKELVIEQEEEGVSTAVVAILQGSKKEQIGYRAWKDNPIAIGEFELRKNFSNPNGDIYFNLYTITTTDFNEAQKHSKVRISLMSAAAAEPSELQFTAEGGTKRVNITFGSNERFGATVEGGKGWCTLSSQVGSGTEISGDTQKGLYLDVKVQPNTGEESRSCTINCWVSDYLEHDKMPFTIQVTQTPDGDKWKVNSIYLHADLLTTEHWDWDIPVADEDTRRTYNFDIGFASTGAGATLAGTTLHVSEEYDAYGLYGANGKSHHTISYDILNFNNEDFSNCKVKDIVVKDTDQDASGMGTVYELKVPELYLERVETTDYNVSFVFKASGSALKASLDDYYDDRNGMVIHYYLKDNASNTIELNTSIKRPTKE